MDRSTPLLSVLFAILAMQGCSEKQQTPTARNANVLLITIDTLRPDRLSCYGSANPTPHIDSIARKGIVFENAFANVPLTFPSHVSILTGLAPPHHGVHNNGLELFRSPELLLSRQLRKNGYQAGAAVASFVLDRKFGLAEGFDFYDDRMERKPGIVSNFEVERPAPEITAAGIQILERFDQRPWFLWLHYYDPHAPYSPTSPFEGYDGEVRWVDAEIGKLMNWLKQRNLDQQLIVAILGDHGESLGEHGEKTHGFFVYNSTLHVPFILAYPGSPSKRISTAASATDFLPTLMDLLGMAPPPQLDGESLLPVISGAERTRDIYFESRYPELLGWNGLRGMFQQNWKLITTTRSELYEWQKDKTESENQFARQQNISRKMKAIVENEFSDSAAPKGNQPDSETLEKLRSLGYVAGTTTSTTRKTGDPKDKIRVWAVYEEIVEMKSGGKTDEALARLKTIVDQEPDNFFFRIALAVDYRKEGKNRDAIEQLETAIRISADPDAFYELAVTYKEMRIYEEAIKAIQAALSMDRDRTEFHSMYGMLLVETGRYEPAIQEFNLVLRIDPNHAVAWNNLGNAMREVGQISEAEQAYRKSIELSPHYAYPLNGLAVLLIRSGKAAESIPYLQKAIDLDPKYVEIYLNLGIAYHKLGDSRRAETLYKSFLAQSPEWMVDDRRNARLLLGNLQKQYGKQDQTPKN